MRGQGTDSAAALLKSIALEAACRQTPRRNGAAATQVHADWLAVL